MHKEKDEISVLLMRIHKQWYMVTLLEYNSGILTLHGHDYLAFFDDKLLFLWASELLWLEATSSLVGSQNQLPPYPNPLFLLLLYWSLFVVLLDIEKEFPYKPTPIRVQRNEIKLEHTLDKLKLAIVLREVKNPISCAVLIKGVSCQLLSWLAFCCLYPSSTMWTPSPVTCTNQLRQVGPYVSLSNFIKWSRKKVGPLESDALFNSWSHTLQKRNT